MLGKGPDLGGKMRAPVYIGCERMLDFVWKCLASTSSNKHWG